jgi:exodeoxyribonuclease VII large subunit
MFSSAARKAGFTPAHGQQVVCKGRAEFYAPSGRLSFIVERIEPVGAGARELALRQLIEEARRLGWLDPHRKRPLPIFPRRVAVVTSAQGAALQDVLVTMKRRCPAVGVAVLDVRVQGDRAAHEIAAAMRYLSLNAPRLGIDAIILTRGGGSAEDLWAFNDRAIAEAIVTCSVPVVAAIGHETDTSLAEMVADERCATPTQAAVRLTPDTAALLRQLDSLATRLRTLTQRQHRHEAQRLDHAGRSLHAHVRASLLHRGQHLERWLSRLARRSPAAVHARLLSRAESARAGLASAIRAALARRDPGPLAARLDRAARTRLRELASGLAGVQRTLQGVSPLAVLERGYSVTLRRDGSAVRSPADVTPGDTLETRLRDGSIRSTVTDAAGKSPHRKPSRPAPSPDTPGLFGGA